VRCVIFLVALFLAAILPGPRMVDESPWRIPGCVYTGTNFNGVETCGEWTRTEWNDMIYPFEVRP
jgi:hypothetical protein